MFKEILKTVKHTLIYSIGNLSIKMVGFILLPLYTSYLTTADYGLLAIIEAVAQFSIAILGFRLSTAMLRWASAEKDVSEQGKIIFTSLIAMLALIIPFTISFYLFADYLSTIIFNSSQFTKYIYFLSIYILVENYNIFVLDLLRLRDKSLMYIIIVLVKLVFSLSLNIYFVAYAQIGIDGIVLSMLISSIVFSVLTIPFLIRQISFHFKIKIAKEMFYYGYPLVFSTVSTMVLTLSDRFVIRHYYTYSEVGVYNLGYKIASVINVVLIQSFQMGFLPIAFKTFDKPNAKEFFSNILTYFTLVLVFAILLISYFSKEIIILLSKDVGYINAYKIVPFISATFLIKGIYYLFSLGLHYVKKTKYNTFIVMTGAIINIIFNFILIPYFDVYGAAVASIISSFVIMLLYYYYSQREYYINYNIKRIVEIILIAFIFVIPLYFIKINMITDSAIKLLLSILFLFIVLKKPEKQKALIILKYFPNINKIKKELHI